jgi:hypothetical protein
LAAAERAPFGGGGSLELQAHQKLEILMRPDRKNEFSDFFPAISGVEALGAVIF